MTNESYWSDDIFNRWVLDIRCRLDDDKQEERRKRNCYWNWKRTWNNVYINLLMRIFEISFFFAVHMHQWNWCQVAIHCYVMAFFLTHSYLAVVGQHSRMVVHCIDRFRYQLDMQSIDLQSDLIHTLMQMQHQHLAGSVDMQTRRNHPIISSMTVLENLKWEKNVNRWINEKHIKDIEKLPMFLSIRRGKIWSL